MFCRRACRFLFELLVLLVCRQVNARSFSLAFKLYVHVSEYK